MSKAGAVARASTAVAVAITVAVAAIGAGVAGAQATGGGTAPPGDPAITDVLCVTKCIKPRKGVIGSKVRIIGSDLQQVRVVSLPRSDGKRAKDMSPYVKPSGAVLAYVKAGAITGSVRVADSYGQRKDSPAAFKIGTKAQLRKARQKYKFPVPGPHQYWDGLGAGRGHQGQDIGAACKARIIVAHSGKVIERSGAGPEGAAGNYVMIFNRRDNRTHTYMHLFNPPAIAQGDLVTTGQFLGKVGQTGRASGCHLHFELRAGRGWGQVLNPTPLLRTWDKYS